jgi:hypothetical protein
VNKPLDSLTKAIDMAVPALHNAMGMSTDIELENYKRLTPDDFDEVARRFGLDDTVGYIEDMERRMTKEE